MTKTLFSVLILLSLIGLASEVRSATFTSVLPGAWSAPATWGTATVPTFSDVVRIDHPVTLNAGTYSSGTGGSSVTIRNNGSLTITGNLTLQQANTLIVVETGGTLEITGIFRLENASKTNLTGGLIKTGSLVLPDHSTSSGINYTSGTITVTTNELYIGNAATFDYSPNIAVPGPVTLRNGKTLNLTAAGGNLTVAAASILNLVSGTYSPSSLSVNDANTELRISGATLNYASAMNITNGQKINISSGRLNLTNSLTVDGGAFSAASGTIVNIGNSTGTNLTVTSSGSNVFTNAGTMTVTGSVSVSGSLLNTGTLTVSVNYTQGNTSPKSTTSSGIFTVLGNVAALGPIKLNPGPASTMTVHGILTVNDNPWIVVGTSVSTCNTVVTEYANLIAYSNVALTGSGDIVVNQSGRFVVMGNISTSGSGNLMTINCGGQAYVHGNINLGMGGGNTITNSNGPGSPTGSNGSPVIGLYVNGSTTAQNVSGTVGNQAALKANNADFFTYIAQLPNSPLPVKLLYFNVASIDGNGITLKWVTTMEKNFDRFEIQRAGTDLVFSTIGTLAAKGGMDLNTPYEFGDAAPLQGKNYYRLKNIDLDAMYEYSSVIVGAWDRVNKGISIYPNPVVNGTFTIELNDVFASPASISVLEARGYVVYTTNVGASSSTITLPGDLRAGIYLVKISSSARQETVRIVVTQ